MDWLWYTMMVYSALNILVVMLSGKPKDGLLKVLGIMIVLFLNDVLNLGAPLWLQAVFMIVISSHDNATRSNPVMPTSAPLTTIAPLTTNSTQNTVKDKIMMLWKSDFYCGSCGEKVRLTSVCSQRSEDFFVDGDCCGCPKIYSNIQVEPSLKREAYTLSTQKIKSTLSSVAKAVSRLSVRCNYCGAKNTETNCSCTQCGAPL